MPATPPKYVKLVQPDGGMVLAIANGSDENEAKAVVAKDDNSPSQQWRLVPDGDFVKIVNRKSGKVLDVFNESADEGSPIIQWDDKSEGNDNQRWAWEGAGKARRLKSKSSGLVLDVADENAIVQKKPDDAAKGQLWQVVEVKE
jgi:hypothetical protein